ncbi:membrane protein [Paractinoplanes deccanensis]|uniref:Membrane protein n=1 Tax=Paractinoplanes deccanensis TaxID=113561 RepID=A0ABQ3Y292_9ACTN|nr:M23 family metallopeptidase [Actinoplanes deccanensis]GID74112.1 membrane protein [Actinoplanes deccanensis]
MSVANWEVLTVPHRAEPRTGGRHRQETVRRHVALPSVFTTRRSRTVLLAAALGAGLVTGVTGGVAAAAESWQNDKPADLPVSIAADLGSGDELAPGDSFLAADAPPFAAGDVAAQQSRLKTRPKPIAVATEPAADRPAPAAAWVNPNPAGRVTSCYGPRWGRMHQGVDIAGPYGSPILAVGAGVVVRAGEAAGYGNAVLVDHGNGYLTHYGHLATVAVRAGDHVRTGQRIGDEGSTGHSTGPHLHLEVHAGAYKNPVEPTRWLSERGVRLRGC